MKILSHIKKKGLNDWESSKFIKCQKNPGKWLYTRLIQMKYSWFFGRSHTCTCTNGTQTEGGIFS